MLAKKYLPHVDGLRAIAIVAVVLYHADGWLPGGFVGVDIFFVISGYLITGIICRELAEGNFSFSGFWVRRIKRIIPAMSVMVFLVGLAGWLLSLPHDYREIGQSIIAQALSLANVYFFRESGYFSAGTETMPLLHTWSLSVEEQFYVILPLVCFLIYRIRRQMLVWALVVILITSLLISAYQVRYSPDAAFYLLPARAWELVLGSMGAIIARRIQFNLVVSQVLSFVGLALVFTSIVFYKKDMRFPGLAAFPPCLGALMLILADQNYTTCVGRFISLKPFVWVGLISYSLYLWHWPLFAFLNYHAVNPTSVQVVAVIVFSLILSYLSWRFIETPFRGVSINPRRTIFWGLAVLASLACVGLGIHMSKGVPSRYTNDANRFVTGEPLFHPFRAKTIDLPISVVALREFPLLTSASVVSGVNRSVLLWGDSHADALVSAFVDAGNQAGIPVYAATRGGLLPVFGAFDGLSDPTKREVFTQAVRKFIQEAKITDVFLHARWPGYLNSNFKSSFSGDSGLKNTVRELRDLGCHVFIIKSIPYPGFQVPRRFALATQAEQDLKQYDMTFEQHCAFAHEADFILDSMKNEGANVVDVTNCFFHDLPFFSPQQQGFSLYADDHHLSVRGAKILLPMITLIFHEIASGGGNSFAVPHDGNELKQN